MKKSLTALILVLCMILGVLSFASCGGSGAEATSATEAATAPATEAKTDAKTEAKTDAKTEAATGVKTEAATEAKTEAATDASTEPETEPETIPETTVDPELKWETIGPKVAGLAERARTLKIECSIGGSAEKMSKNDIYVKGPDTVDPETPKIQQMIYARNKAANERLGTTVEYVFWDYGFGNQAGQINTVVQGKDPNAPDLFVNMLNDLNKELRNSSFKDIYTIPNHYFDFDEKGWLKEWMENLSFSGDRAYILGSDYFLDIMRAISVIPFNMTLMDDNAAILASAILEEDEELEDGEPLTPYFFDLVEEGGWTWEVLGKLCDAIFVDVDGDGTNSINDRLGIIADGYGGINAASFIYSCGEKLTETYFIEDESSEYNGKQWIKYADDSTDLNRIFDAVKSVFVGRGSLTTSYPFASNSPDQPGASYHHTKFGKGELLFGGICTLGTLEDDAFQLMTDLFSVVPCPKVDASKSYNTIIINQGDAGAINVNCIPARAKVLTAYLQYCTEHSTAIREEFQQIVTKYKTTTYDQGTDRMLDIIYDGILYGRDYTVEGENEEPRWHRFMMSEKFVAGAEEITSVYEKNRATKQALLDKTIEDWYKLPKS